MKTDIKTFINSSNSSKLEFARNFFINPINEGLVGFGIFFVILITIGFINNLIGVTESFSVKLTDILLSSLGFVCFFLISILSNFKED